MSKKIWLYMHPRNFVVTWPYVRLTARPSAPQVHQCKILNQQVWQLKCSSRFYLAGNRMAARTVFFDVIFDVFTHVGNGERARGSDCKQRRLISLQGKHENVVAAVRKWEILAASKVKMRAVWKKKRTGTQATRVLMRTYTNSAIQIMCNHWGSFTF